MSLIQFSNDRAEMKQGNTYSWRKNQRSFGRPGLNGKELAPLEWFSVTVASMVISIVANAVNLFVMPAQYKAMYALGCVFMLCILAVYVLVWRARGETLGMRKMRRLFEKTGGSAFFTYSTEDLFGILNDGSLFGAGLRKDGAVEGRIIDRRAVQTVLVTDDEYPLVEIRTSDPDSSEIVVPVTDRKLANEWAYWVGRLIIPPVLTTSWAL